MSRINSSFITLWCKWTVYMTGVRNSSMWYTNNRKVIQWLLWEAELAEWWDKVSQGSLWALQYSPILVKGQKPSLCSFQHLCISTQAHLNSKGSKANKLTTLQCPTKDWLQELYMVYDGKLLMYRYSSYLELLKTANFIGLSFS